MQYYPVRVRRIIMKKGVLFFILFSSCCLCGCCKSELEKKAEKGDLQSQYQLAQEYKNKKDYDSMVKWLEKAANKDFLKAQESLAMDCFLNGNRITSLKWAQKAAEQNSEIGKSVLAYYYYWGNKDFSIDRIKALELVYETKDVPLSKAILACYYQSGFWNIERDLDKAKELANESLNDGCPEGGMVLANTLRIINEKNGSIFGVDNEQIDILRKCAEMNYSDAIMSITVMDALEKKLDFQKAYKILDSYAKLDNSIGYSSIANLERVQDAENTGDISRIDVFELKKKQLYAGSCDSALLEELLYLCNKIKMPKEKKNSEVKKILEKAIEIGEPSSLRSIYCFANPTTYSHMPILKDQMPEVNMDDIIKKGADNGSGILMAFHANNVKSNKKEYEKYINQARKLGIDDGYRTYFKNFNDKLKLYSVGATACDARCLLSLGCSFYTGNNIGKQKVEKNVEKGLSLLEDALLYAEKIEKGYLESVKELIMETLTKSEDLTVCKDKVYVLSLICSSKKDDEFVQNLEKSFEEEELNNLRKEADELKKKIAKNK